MEERKVFWTGGWDSTFRIVQLSREAVKICPVYISGDGRPSEQKEIETMHTILDLLKSRTETKAEFLPIEIVDKKDIPEDIEITKAYEKIRTEIRIGTQYEYLARYAKVNPGVELCAECPDGEFSGIMYAIEKLGELIAEHDSWRLDVDKATKECVFVFGNFSLPVAKVTEREMKHLIQEWKYEDIMKHIWFCHTPIKGQPCGFCRPCEQKMDMNMDFLLPEIAQKRYNIMKSVKKLFGGFGEKVLKRLFFFRCI